jgi:CheY-like chemotaxis protein
VNRLLSRQGFHAIEARDGPSALSAVQERGGEIVALVTDIEMEGMSGIDLAKSVISKFPAIPVLFLSGVAISGDELRRDVPSCAFVQKPFVPANLVQSLRDLLKRCR